MVQSAFNKQQQIIIAMTPVITGLLSVMGWGCIIHVMRQEWTSIKKRVKYRILLAMCISDVMNSITFMLWVPPIPKDTVGVWGALGNDRTCNFSGFFVQLGLLGSFYNGALSLYFMQSLCNGKTDQEIAAKYEIPMNVFAIVWSVGTAFACLFQDLYAYSMLGCWIAPEPQGCYRNSDLQCTRGEDAFVFAWIYTGIPLFLVCLYIAYAMAQIYKTVRTVSKRAERWAMAGATLRHSSSLRDGFDEQQLSNTETGQGDGGAGQRNASTVNSGRRGSNSDQLSRYAAQTKEAAIQAFLYVLVYFITHVWAFVVYNTELLGYHVPFWCTFLQQLFWPLQGVGNVFIFLRPRIRIVRQRLPGITLLRAAFVATFYFDEENRTVKINSLELSERARRKTISSNARNKSINSEGSQQREKNSSRADTESASPETPDSAVAEVIPPSLPI